MHTIQLTLALLKGFLGFALAVITFHVTKTSFQTPTRVPKSDHLGSKFAKSVEGKG